MNCNYELIQQSPKYWTACIILPEPLTPNWKELSFLSSEKKMPKSGASKIFFRFAFKLQYKFYPPASEASKEVANLTERKCMHHWWLRPVFVHPIYHVCLKNGEMGLFRQCF